MRVLIVSLSQPGHTVALRGVVRTLVARGHTVGWLLYPPPHTSPWSVLHTLPECGAEMLKLSAFPLPPWYDAARTNTQSSLLKNRSGRLASAFDATIEMAATHADLVSEVIGSFRPDVISVDNVLLAPFIAAHRSGIPYVVVATGLDPITSTSTLPDGGTLRAAMIERATRRRSALIEHGVNVPYGAFYPLSPYGNSVFTTKAFVGNDFACQAPTRLVGAAWPDPLAYRTSEEFPWNRLRPEKPLVVVSFGSQVSHQPQRVGVVAEAAAELSATLVVNVNGFTEDEVAALPGDVIGLPEIPQVPLLKDAAAFVSHGGYNSVCESLYFGVPLLVSPIDTDQPVQAHHITNIGAGIHLDLATASKGRVQVALEQLIHPDGPMRAAAQRIGTHYRKKDGAAGAADLLLEVASAKVATP